MAERDLVGYGGRPPQPRSPGQGRAAGQVVLAIQEGAQCRAPERDGRP